MFLAPNFFWEGGGDSPNSWTCIIKFSQVLIMQQSFRAIGRGTYLGERVARKIKKLEVHGRARREAARRRKSEWKVDLGIRNSSRSNGSWRMTT